MKLRTIRITLTYLLAIVALLFVASFLFVCYFAVFKNVPQHADAAIVLGAKVNLDDTPSDPLQHRTDQAVTLFKDGTVSRIITTGGQGLGYIPESKSARAIALSDGVPISDILIETDSHTTYENIQDIMQIASEYNIQSVIIVSDRFHLARGVLVAKFFGFKKVYWDYPAESSYTAKELAINYVRESAAILAYVPRLIFEQTGLKTIYTRNTTYAHELLAKIVGDL